MKWWFILPAGVLIIAAGLVHHLHLDTLFWHQWQANGTALPAHALNLGKYQVDIEARVIKGVDDDISALTFNSETRTLWAVLNGEPLMIELDLTGSLLRTVRIDGVSDMEGLTHVAGNRYVVAEERTQRLLLIDIPANAEQVDVSAAPAVTIGLDTNGNKGFEGLSWDGYAQRLLVVKERDPLRVIAVTGFVEGVPGAAMNVHISELKPADATPFKLRDLSSLTMHDDSGHMLLLSDESRLVAEFNEKGELLSMMGLWFGMSGLKHNVPQAEGIAVDDRRHLYIVSEPNLFYRFSPVK